MAAAVLEGKERAARWLREPNRALGARHRFACWTPTSAAGRSRRSWAASSMESGAECWYGVSPSVRAPHSTVRERACTVADGTIPVCPSSIRRNPSLWPCSSSSSILIQRMPRISSRSALTSPTTWPLDVLDLRALPRDWRGTPAPGLTGRSRHGRSSRFAPEA
jgi:hypothetical protein